MLTNPSPDAQSIAFNHTNAQIYAAFIEKVDPIKGLKSKASYSLSTQKSWLDVAYYLGVTECCLPFWITTVGSGRLPYFPEGHAKMPLLVVASCGLHPLALQYGPELKALYLSLRGHLLWCFGKTSCHQFCTNINLTGIFWHKVLNWLAYAAHLWPLAIEAILCT